MNMIEIAILGDGQLSNMLENATLALDISVVVFPLPEKIIDIKALYSENLKWSNLLKDFNIVTYESENISVDILNNINKKTKVYPSIPCLEICQDRLKEKDTLIRLNIPTNSYMNITKVNDLKLFSENFSFPFLVKSRRFGYDGKGQCLIKDNEDIEKCYKQFKKIDIIAESLVHFDYEVSLVACRDVFRNIVYYPLVKNIHSNGILRETLVVDINDNIYIESKSIITKIMEEYDYVGTMSVEFFVLEDTLLVNEIAPRVHNSGHWSMSGSSVSQFKNHMLAVSGQRVVEPKNTFNYIRMINIIGENECLDSIKSTENIHVFSYNKDKCNKNRKMGHINIVDNNKSRFLKACDKVYSNIEAKKYS